LTWAQATIAELKSNATLANFIVIRLVSLSQDIVQYTGNYFGIGIDTGLPGAAFGDPDRLAGGLHSGWCLEPFLYTVTWALSPSTVITEILPLPL
jgi:hypothetical protein